VTKPQSTGPISCLEHRATRVLHCAIVTGAAVLMFPLLGEVEEQPFSVYRQTASSKHSKFKEDTRRLHRYIRSRVYGQDVEIRQWTNLSGSKFDSVGRVMDILQ